MKVELESEWRLKYLCEKEEKDRALQEIIRLKQLAGILHDEGNRTSLTEGTITAPLIDFPLLCG